MHLGQTGSLPSDIQQYLPVDSDTNDQAIARMVARFNRDEALKKEAALKGPGTAFEIPWIPLSLALLVLRFL